MEADPDGVFFAFTTANLPGRILAYACGSETQAVALMDNLMNGLLRERGAGLVQDKHVVPGQRDGTAQLV